MECRLFELLIQRYYDGELDQAERSEYESHRRACENCRELDERYALLARALARVPLFEPSSDFNRKVLSHIDVAAYRSSVTGRVLGAIDRLWNAAPIPVRNGAVIAAVCALFIAVYKPLLDYMIDTIRLGSEGLWSGMVFVKEFLGKAEIIWKGLGTVRTYEVVAQTLLRAFHRYASGLNPVQIAVAVVSLILIAVVLYRMFGTARRKGETNVCIL